MIPIDQTAFGFPGVTVNQNTVAAARMRAVELVEELAKHRIRNEGEGRWLCAKPGTRNYSFRVITSPGAVIIHGDIGDAIFCMNERDPLPWLRTVAMRHEVDYLLGKMRAGPEKVFYVGDAERILRERLAEGDDEAADVGVSLLFDADGEDPFDCDAEVWGSAWVDAGADEVPDCTDYSFSAWWLAEALCWFGRTFLP